ncbi:hypothetical protein LCGC14_3096560 [marine sediment metagenome]|uniref:Uncharacterized protein n=1 Tax=marine sediment metagenome TaxID=412755 RepID=A0A0F8YGF7_9ZZZZ
MKKRDKKRFTEIMLGMADNFRDELSKPGLQFRFDALKEFSIEQVEVAAFKIIKARKYNKMPPVGEIVEAIQGPAPQIEDVAEIQAAEVIRQISPVGYYGCPVFSDPITDRLFQGRFRWQSVCSLAESELRWFVREFKEAYRAYNVVVETPRLEASGELKKLSENIGRVFN